VALNSLNKPLKIDPLSSVNSLKHVVHVAQIIVSIRCIAMYDVAKSDMATLLNAVMSVYM